MTLKAILRSLRSITKIVPPCITQDMTSCKFTVSCSKCEAYMGFTV